MIINPLPPDNLSGLTPVILAGGAGQRLYPLSTPERPKPFLKGASGRSLLQETALRVCSGGPHIVLCHEGHEGLVRGEYADTGLAIRLIVAEPVRRNTGPALALAACLLERDELMLVLPSDHVMTDHGAFRSAVVSGIPHARAGAIVLFGIVPQRAETRYGYIRPCSGGGIAEVLAFHEKPDIDVAGRLVSDGCYWNSGMFLFTAGVLRDGLEEFAPEILSAARASLSAGAHDEGVVRPESTTFSAAPSSPIDKALIERADRRFVVPLSCGWADVGTPESFQGHCGPAPGGA